VDVTVHHRLTRNLPTIHPNVKAFNSLICRQYVSPYLIQQEVDCSPLWLKQVKVSWGVATRDNESMQWTNGEAIPNSEGKFVLCNPLPL
jgi:hypothetical protein